MKRLSILLIIMHLELLSIQVKAQDWNASVIAELPETDALSIILDDGRNDGENRLYVSAGKSVYELSHASDAWSISTTVITGLHADTEAHPLTSMAMGDGRNDGVKRLYVVPWTRGNADVFEVSWNASTSTWDTQSIGKNAGGSGDRATGVTIGDARNDGKVRIYVTGSFGTTEYTWNGSAYDEKTVSGKWGETYGDIGDARNDGVNRYLYGTGCTIETSWDGSNFTESYIRDCVLSHSADEVEIADARNDGVNRVYVNTTEPDNGRFEYTWNGTSYDEQLIVSASPQRGDIHVAALKSDKRQRMYITHAADENRTTWQSGPLQEWTYESGAWTMTGEVLASTSGASSYMDTGDGRNDGVIRMYAPSFIDGKVYEVTATNPNSTGSTCSLASISQIAVKNCDETSGNFDMDVSIIYENEPATGMLEVNGQTFAITGSPQVVTLTDLSASNATIGVTASFTDDSGCSLSIESFVDGTAACTTLGTKSIESITLFPNPARDAVTVQSSRFSQGSVTYTVVSASGTVVLTGSTELENKALKVNIESLSPGMYMLDVVDYRKHRVRARIVKVGATQN